MDGVQQFWTWAYLLGFGSFAVLALIIIPLGLRDLLRLLKDLGRDDHGDREDEDDASP